MVVWKVVERRRKDPGSQEMDQEGQEKVAEEAGAHVGSHNRFTGKIRAEFAVSGRVGRFSAAIEAKKLFVQMTRVEPDIVFKSDSDGRITFRKISEFPTGESKFKEFFTVTPHLCNDGTGKVHINFQIESKKRLSFMKRDITFFNYLRDNKIWLTEHKYETHTLQSLGFIVRKSPVLTTRQKLESDIGEALSEYMKNAIDEGQSASIIVDGREFTPNLEISSKNVVHVLREGDKKTGVIETQALEIRCEKNKATQLSKLLCAAELPCHKFGVFVPYGMARNETDVYKRMIHEHNKFLADIVAIPVFGLHTNVMDSISAGLTEFCDDDTLRNHLTEAELTHSGDTVDSEMTENVFLSIEPTQRTDDLGKWLFLTTKRNEEYANNLIDGFLTANAMKTPAYSNHLNDSDSFMKGIRRANKPNTTFQNYAAALRECVDLTSDDNENSSNNHSKPTNANNKKRRQIQINYDEKEFPNLPTTNKTSKTTTQRQQQQQQGTKNPTTQQSNSTIPKGNNNNTELNAMRETFQAQIDMLKLQMEEMKKANEDWKQQNNAAQALRDEKHDAMMKVIQENSRATRSMQDRIVDVDARVHNTEADIKNIVSATDSILAWVRQNQEEKRRAEEDRQRARKRIAETTDSLLIHSNQDDSACMDVETHTATQNNSPASDSGVGNRIVSQTESTNLYPTRENGATEATLPRAQNE